MTKGATQDLGSTGQLGLSYFPVSSHCLLSAHQKYLFGLLKESQLQRSITMQPSLLGFPRTPLPRQSIGELVQRVAEEGLN
jgi:hypothetical protein